MPQALDSNEAPFLTLCPQTLRFVKSLPKRERQPLKNKFKNADPSAIDLLERMLVFDPKKRVTATEALGHDYLAPYHDPTDEPVADEKFDWSFNDADLPVDTWKIMMLVCSRCFMWTIADRLNTGTRRSWTTTMSMPACNKSRSSLADKCLNRELAKRPDKAEARAQRQRPRQHRACREKQTADDDTTQRKNLNERCLNDLSYHLVLWRQDDYIGVHDAVDTHCRFSAGQEEVRKKGFPHARVPVLALVGGTKYTTRASVVWRSRRTDSRRRAGGERQHVIEPVRDSGPFLVKWSLGSSFEG